MAGAGFRFGAARAAVKEPLRCYRISDPHNAHSLAPDFRMNGGDEKVPGGSNMSRVGVLFRSSIGYKHLFFGVRGISRAACRPHQKETSAHTLPYHRGGDVLLVASACAYVFSVLQWKLLVESDRAFDRPRPLEYAAETL